MAICDIYDTVYLSIYLSLFLGIFPSYIGKKNGRRMIKTNKYCSLLSISYFSLFASMLYLGSLGFNPVTDSDTYNFNTLAKLLILVVILFGDLGTGVLLIQSYFHRNYFKNFLNIISDFDRTFTKIGYKFNHQKDFFIYLGLNIGSLPLTAGNVIMQIWNFDHEKIVRIPAVLLFTHLFTFALIYQAESWFAIFNVILKKRFEAVNLILQKINDKSKKQMKMNFKNENRILDVCILSHNTLCDLCDIVNKIFGFVVIIGGLVQFNTIVFAFCYCYYSYSLRPISSLGWFFLALFRIYELTRKAISAHYIACEAHATIRYVNKLLIYSDVSLEEKLKLFAYQIKHRDVRITALDIFTIDGAFALTVIGATTTYITLIYQFQVNKLGCW